MLPELTKIIPSALALAALLSLTCCHRGPTPEQVSCYQGCARQKVHCMLAAGNAGDVERCDGESHVCGEGCRQ